MRTPGTERLGCLPKVTELARQEWPSGPQLPHPAALRTPLCALWLAPKGSPWGLRQEAASQLQTGAWLAHGQSPRKGQEKEGRLVTSITALLTVTVATVCLGSGEPTSPQVGQAVPSKEEVPPATRSRTREATSDNTQCRLPRTRFRPFVHCQSPRSPLGHPTKEATQSSSQARARGPTPWECTCSGCCSGHTHT